MPLTTYPLTVDLLAITGQAVTGATVTARLVNRNTLRPMIERDADGNLVWPGVVTAQTDSSGAAVLQLVPTSALTEESIYAISITAGGITLHAGLYEMPAEAANLSDLINVPFPARPGTARVGPPGETGSRGPQGEQGDTGATGAQGEQGDQGEQGETGARGVDGLPGADGATGAQGEQGDQGATGQRGVPGPPGADGRGGGGGGGVGARGPQGIQGERGLQGVQGIQGERGLQGIQGERGLQGIQGERGLQGIQGERGLQGIQGERGLQGAQGERGLQGAQGDEGPQGPQGPAGTGGSGGALVFNPRVERLPISAAAALSVNTDGVALAMGDTVEVLRQGGGGASAEIIGRNADNTAHIDFLQAGIHEVSIEAFVANTDVNGRRNFHIGLHSIATSPEELFRGSQVYQRGSEAASSAVAKGRVYLDAPATLQIRLIADVNYDEPLPLDLNVVSGHITADLMTASVEDDPVPPPVPTPIRFRMGWIANGAPSASDLVAMSTTNVLVVPTTLLNVAFLVLWRSDVGGGDPASIFFSMAATNWRTSFGDAMALEVEGVAGQAIVTDQVVTTSLFAGEEARIE